ncbi:MAG: YggS family pyridoxal phosphate-dependent enzyme [Xanthomonadaceae bacterium]|nr:YggS family pyridoxal phosphate-dependent enzyme [Xanthomonadaceae bacterium]
MQANQPRPVRLAEVEQRIEQACLKAGRKRDEVVLLGVSKTRSVDEIRTLYGAGLTRFGENYVAEAIEKLDRLTDLKPQWHFIGPVQSNKTRILAERFDWVQSIDRAKIIRRLGEQRSPEQNALNVLIQVNIDHEDQKSGCDPEQVDRLTEAIAGQPTLCLRGLMAIPSANQAPFSTRQAFARLRALYEHLQGRHCAVDTLSMGMSGDLEDAIAEGSTMVRIGTSLFGPQVD